MLTPEPNIVRGFSLRKEHLEYLNRINPDNDSQALRTCLDRLIALDGNNVKKQRLVGLNGILVTFAFGAFFVLYSYSSYLYSNTLSFILSTAIGLILVFYALFLVVMDYKIR